MLKVAVTGGIGSGKSSVCRGLARHGVPTLSADELAKRLSVTDRRARAAIRRLFGPEAFRRDGSLDTAFVAAKAFSRPALLRRLEGIVHPLVRASIRRWFRSRARAGTPVAVVEAALVYESGMERDVDLVVVVDAYKKDRIGRIRRRDGSTAASVRRRMAAQMSDRDRRARADILITNNGTRRDLARQTDFLARLLRRLSRRG